MRVSNLPPMVAPVNGALVLRSSSLLDANRLADKLREVPTEKLPCVMAAINGLGMMYTHWWLELSVRLGAWRNQSSRARQWAGLFHTLATRSGTDARDTLVQSMRDQTVYHILRGKDREDDNSVGGFSKREMQAVANMLVVAASPSPRGVDDYVVAACNRVQGAFL